jgi:hypothetical protein
LIKNNTITSNLEKNGSTAKNGWRTVKSGCPKGICGNSPRNLDIRLMKYTDLFFAKGKRLHLLFSLALLLLFVLAAADRHDTALLPGLLFTYLFLLAGVYTGRWICRKYFLTAKWFALAGAVLTAIIALSLCGLAGVYFLFVRVSLHDVDNDLLEAVTVSGAILFLGFFIAVTRSAIREKMNGLVLAEQKKAGELSLLRSQVSPHFLFNTLHNLYSLSINKPAQMPGLLLKLSELLRYSVYEADHALVSLNDDLNYIRNYAALENIRVSDRLSLNMELDVVRPEVRIAPMLLIVFVENAFKHARDTPSKEMVISITLKVTAGSIFFAVTNSCGEPAQSKHSGFGLDNVVKRLDLLYPGAYQLRQERNNGFFNIELELKSEK